MEYDYDDDELHTSAITPPELEYKRLGFPWRRSGRDGLTEKPQFLTVQHKPNHLTQQFQLF
jgi:hypothetical protein